jgi:protein-tyrosine phosphatase
MNACEAFVDIHCHLLPGIDDGSQSWEQSLEMAAMAVGDGIATIVATPHQLGQLRP